MPAFAAGAGARDSNVPGVMRHLTWALVAAALLGGCSEEWLAVNVDADPALPAEGSMLVCIMADGRSIGHRQLWYESLPTTLFFGYADDSYHSGNLPGREGPGEVVVQVRSAAELVGAGQTPIELRPGQTTTVAVVIEPWPEGTPAPDNCYNWERM